MKQTTPFLPLPALLLLSACNGGSDSSSAASAPNVEDLTTGVYTVSTGDANAPTVGKYYSGFNGDRLLVLNGSNDQATQLYQRQGNNVWESTPTQSATVTLLRHDAALTAGNIAVSSFAGNYVTQAAQGINASFTVSSGGVISANATDCKISGQLSAGSMPDTLKLNLKTVNCGSLPSSSSGYLMADNDYAPAAFRLLTVSGQQIVDLWSYAD
ncbi:MAG: hypothetical protein HZT40_20215 [Candidatus Thiothrix singaporensis]|uniref:Lipoprotein n=1 Tax=Candidatus Thiothrix singaporensis TaxID=2799669 RepID=A0A7L6AWY1_9GAMM|nr:MAG: hypothetical protein HZT40_20215 [Candidatus Thiothrix singaporensis]